MALQGTNTTTSRIHISQTTHLRDQSSLTSVSAAFITGETEPLITVKQNTVSPEGAKSDSAGTTVLNNGTRTYITGFTETQEATETYLNETKRITESIGFHENVTTDISVISDENNHTVGFVTGTSDSLGEAETKYNESVTYLVTGDTQTDNMSENQSMYSNTSTVESFVSKQEGTQFVETAQTPKTNPPKSNETSGAYTITKNVLYDTVTATNATEFHPSTSGPVDNVTEVTNENITISNSSESVFVTTDFVRQNTSSDNASDITLTKIFTTSKLESNETLVTVNETTNVTKTEIIESTESILRTVNETFSVNETTTEQPLGFPVTGTEVFSTESEQQNSPGGSLPNTTSK